LSRARDEPGALSGRLTRWTRRDKMFGKLWDKADWAVAALLVAAMAAAVIL